MFGDFGVCGGVDTTRLEDKIALLMQEMTQLKKPEVRLRKAPDQQIALSDPDARAMKSRDNGIVGYNVQSNFRVFGVIPP